MVKQRCLEFTEPQHLERLWERFPEAGRAEVTQHFARLMSRTLIRRIRALQAKQEKANEPHHD